MNSQIVAHQGGTPQHHFLGPSHLERRGRCPAFEHIVVRGRSFQGVAAVLNGRETEPYLRAHCRLLR